MKVLNHANLSSENIAGIAAELSGQKNLKDVMAWALSHPRGISHSFGCRRGYRAGRIHA